MHQPTLFGTWATTPNLPSATASASQVEDWNAFQTLWYKAGGALLANQSVRLLFCARLPCRAVLLSPFGTLLSILHFYPLLAAFPHWHVAAALA
jgi:hypothetical protein